MAGYVPNAKRADLLNYLMQGTVYLGLATNVPDDPLTATLADITEVAVAGYSRVQIPASSAATTTTPVQKKVPTAFQFGAFSADLSVPVNYAFITNAASGTAGEIRYLFELPQSTFIRAGEPVKIPANSLILE